MNMKEVKLIARTMEINAEEIGKTALIRAIQEKEGNTPCYQTGQSSCVQQGCCWRSDCLLEEKLRVEL